MIQQKMLLSYISVPKEQPDGSITYVRLPLDDFKATKTVQATQPMQATQPTQPTQPTKQSRDWVRWFRGLRI